ncbi:hypothetical protein BJ742DRAFT_762790 [Cladochytrium replicatum]|nr:hypothetical protein BJ742DRAFT_762790 [Cladochytrium replicatum]
MDSIRGPEILENWKTEAIDQGFSENLVEIAFEEVCADARRVSQLEKEQIERNVRSCVPVPHALDMVYCGDNSGAIPMISSLLREKLISELRVLEDVPESAKDWHPESDNKVLDLIHPSLFPICFGKTGGLKSSQILANLPWDQLLGAGNPVNVPCPFIAHVPRGISMKTPAPDIEWMKFQWLPAEIFVEQDCTTHIRSYINNLHPHDHADLYGTIGGIFGRFVPLFEAVLTDFLHWPYPLTPRVVINSEEEYYEGGFEMYAAWEHSRRENDNIEPLTVVQPTVPTANEPRLRALWLSDPEDVLRVNLRNRSLQVIVKVASIHLTPEDPVYGGGVWHTEGMEHEAIVATGIYYYDTDNITTSKLSFRAGVAGEHVPYYQYDWEGVRQMYGIEIDKGPTQIWGSIEAAEGLCVAFPNVYQHKVEPFELVDKTRPGHRKILVFFLVNPNLKVPSSVEIPPQQMDWYWRELEEIRRGRKGRSFLQGLPVEVFKRVREILESMPWEERKVLTIEEAKEIRRELMAERKYDVDKVTKELYTREVSLCEH